MLNDELAHAQKSSLRYMRIGDVDVKVLQTIFVVSNNSVRFSRN